jgi:hypothetical protein
MANVNHPDFALLNGPKDEIGISTDRRPADSAARQGMADVWILADRVDGPPDGELNAESTPWAALIEVFQNPCEIVLRTPRVADDHKP